MAWKRIGFDNIIIIVGDPEHHRKKSCIGKDTLHGNIDRKRISDLNAIYNPLSYVGIKIRTWYRVMTQHGRLPMPCTTIGIVKYFGEALSTSCDSRLTRPGCRPEYDQLKATSVEIKE
ncbi:hypothetical protein LSH36_748g02075 [Paralvinella palmiformis]|uniref:Uncharacterized protein n=1 Tax=Paralvinella palmiformis TaxID=53620 RepID=A0AAD9J2Q2_9ANNE|nr:hypothetical protein LSH36_748g02075 [Paralvinella palmiformis]